MRHLKLSDKNAKITGRYSADGDVLWLIHSGSAAAFELTASKAELTLKSDKDSGAYKDGKPRFAVFVNDELVSDNVTGSEGVKITVLDSDSEKTAYVKIIHLSEAQSGAVGIVALEAESEAADPVKPLLDKKYSIEFIGDSITCAYGVESECELDMFTTKTENFMKSYAYLTAQKLDADCSAVSFSGFGVVSAYTDTGIKDAARLVPDFYLYAGNLPEFRKLWDFERKHHDIVVVFLGTNDINYVAAAIEHEDEFKEGYLSFLKTVREKNPDAFIVCTMGTMGTGNVYKEIEKAVAEFKNISDENILCFRSEEQNGADGYGADWHPSAITQQKCADRLSEVLKGILQNR